MDKKKIILIVIVLALVIGGFVVFLDKDEKSNTVDTDVQNKEPEILHNIPVTETPSSNGGVVQPAEDFENEFEDKIIFDNVIPMY